MTKEEYQVYLQSRHWIRFRRATLLKRCIARDSDHAELIYARGNRAGSDWIDRIISGDCLFPFLIECEDCGASFRFDQINLHHLTYERLYKEREDDLVAICTQCHEKRHGIEAAV